MESLHLVTWEHTRPGSWLSCLFCAPGRPESGSRPRRTRRPRHPWPLLWIWQRVRGRERRCSAPAWSHPGSRVLACRSLCPRSRSLARGWWKAKLGLPGKWCREAQCLPERRSKPPFGGLPQRRCQPLSCCEEILALLLSKADQQHGSELPLCLPPRDSTDDSELPPGFPSRSPLQLSRQPGGSPHGGPPQKITDSATATVSGWDPRPGGATRESDLFITPSK